MIVFYDMAYFPKFRDKSNPDVRSLYHLLFHILGIVLLYDIASDEMFYKSLFCINQTTFKTYLLTESNEMILERKVYLK